MSVPRPVDPAENSQETPLVSEKMGGAGLVAPDRKSALAAFSDAGSAPQSSGGSIAALLSRFRRFPIDADDAADLIAAAVEGKLAPARERRGGRPPINDDAALTEMVGHIEGGATPTVAALLVARVRPGHSVEATAARLLRKFRDREKTKQN